MVDVGIGEHHLGRLAAQFQRDPFQQLTGPRGYPAAHRARAGKADARHQRVADQRVAHLVTQAGHHIQDTSGQADGLKAAHQRQGRHRGVLRWFDNHCVACGQCRRNLPGQQGQRRVPGSDGCDHAIGFPDRVVEHVGLVQGDHAAFKFVSQARKVIKVLGQPFDLGPDFGQALAVVAALCQREAIDIGRDGLAQLSQPGTALGRPKRGPRPFKGGPVGGLRGPGHIAGIALRDAGPDCAG